jgi:hypothetical protein
VAMEVLSVSPTEEHEEAGPVPVVHLSLNDADTSHEVGASASAFEGLPRPPVVDVHTAAPLILTVLLAVHARVMVTLQSAGDTAPADALLELAGVLCSVVVRLAAASQSLVYKTKHMILFTHVCDTQLRTFVLMVWTHTQTHKHTHTHTHAHCRVCWQKWFRCYWTYTDSLAQSQSHTGRAGERRRMQKLKNTRTRS